MKNLILLSWMIFSAFIINAQSEFYKDNSIINEQKFRSTLSIGIADMDGDYMDDIVILEKGTDLFIAYQNERNTKFRITEHGKILEKEAWALSLGDLNNDGISELFACGINTFGNIFKITEQGNYAFEQLLFGLTFPQNSNFADIDNNGWLDVFICDERAYNDLFLNDGSGQLVYNDFIDMHTVPPSNDSGNYGSEWVDFDDDRDLDLFITKCKPGIESPMDPLRVNVLFENNGSNTYSEQSRKYGLDNGSQSWTGSFGDIDNDGDLDCFVSNHDTTHIIYRNIDNDTFVDVTEQLMPPVKSSSIQAAIRDFDNNGFMDIYVTGERDDIMWNLGNDTWMIQSDPFGDLEAFTFACGDLNDDGFLDVICSYGRLNETGNYDDAIYLNRGNQNHYLKISLYGEESNRKGVGAKVKAFSALGIQTRDVKIGESYGTTNSGNLHFGMGELENIDSLIIYWPSGTIDKYFNVEVDQHLLVHEGKCLNPFFEISYEGDNVLCEGETIELSVPVELVSYQWSTGSTEEMIQINGESDISVRGTDQNGCMQYSKLLKIFYEPDETPYIDFIEGAQVNCKGDIVELLASPAQSYLWSNGESTQSIQIEEDGIYSVSVEGKCQNFLSEEIDVSFFVIDPVELESDTIVLNEEGPVTLTAVGDSVLWFADDLGIEYIASGDLLIPWIDRDTSFFAVNRKDFVAPIKSVGMIDHLGTLVGGTNLNSGLIFNCWDTLYLEEVKVITDLEGKRRIELRQLLEDGTQKILNVKDIFVEEGVQNLALGFMVTPGLDYILTTNVDTNLLHLGQKSPEFYRSNEGVQYPYNIEGLLDITTSLHGHSYYYYFYDWKVRAKGISCMSDAKEVAIVLDTLSAIRKLDIVSNSFRIDPNPFDKSLRVNWDEVLDMDQIDIAIFDIYGNQKLSMYYTKAEKLDLSFLAAGVYFLKLNWDIDERQVTRLILKTN